MILRPDPVFMPLSVHWAVSGDSLETRNSHEARGSLQRASPEASTRENKRDREFFCRHMANRKADVRCVFSGEESFQPTPLLQTFRGSASWRHSVNRCAFPMTNCCCSSSRLLGDRFGPLSTIESCRKDDHSGTSRIGSLQKQRLRSLPAPMVRAPVRMWLFPRINRSTTACRTPPIPAG